ncbi:hypothetical protein [Bradyrhizobium prioriisuperbiae]|uniref:hypothetical protein n=1 Tax=Bradyrhizobium prioriisuperbiae TaxID=2854389 RepID=UPI0028E36EEB|nr:hypothetical protein [Bradyrhizobium prioritasuperba]
MPAAIRHRAMTVVCLLAALAGACAARADNADAPPKQQFVIRLKEAVRTSDKIWLADHARYPCATSDVPPNKFRTRLRC